MLSSNLGFVFYFFLHTASEITVVVVVVVVDSHIQRIVLATEETTVTQQKSVIDLSSANPACGHKEVRRSTGHIIVTTRYSDQQGSKSRQKVMRLYKQRRRPISKRFIKPPYSISRATSIDSERYITGGHPGSSEVPRNPLTRWDVSSIPANGIFLTKKKKKKKKKCPTGGERLTR